MVAPLVLSVAISSSSLAFSYLHFVSNSVTILWNFETGRSTVPAAPRL